MSANPRSTSCSHCPNSSCKLAVFHVITSLIFMFFAPWARALIEVLASIASINTVFFISFEYRCCIFDCQVTRTYGGFTTPRLVSIISYSFALKSVLTVLNSEDKWRGIAHSRPCLLFHCFLMSLCHPQKNIIII